MTHSIYIHGTTPEEQERLSLLNGLLNAASLRAMRLCAGDRVLDLGCGLGQLARAMARQVGPAGRVVAVERSADQLAEARRFAALDGEEGLVDLRAGSVFEPPLADDEWGTFDIAHARFVLEHLTDPAAVVEVMRRAVRPGGRVILEDDDHDLLRVWPAVPEGERLWRTYARSYEHLGNDPWIGRKLVALLYGAGVQPRRNDMLFFGTCAGSSIFDVMIDNFVGVMAGARAAIVTAGELTEEEVEAGLAAFAEWRRHPDASLWYATCWAEGDRSAADEGSETAVRSAADTDLRLRGDRRIDALEFLADSARDLTSTLRLDEVFSRIAQRVQGLLDAHLFCIMLWNEERELLEHSFSMKFGRHIPQEGGFPLGYGLSGAAAKELRAIRVANVEDDPRYVRFRHAEVDVRSELSVPLVAEDRLVGVLDLESTEFDAFTFEHEQILSALASHIATALENARLYEEIRAKEERLERDLDTARRIQEGLLPKELPQLVGLSVGAARSAALELSGDFYDIFPDDRGGLTFCLGDVAGKGTGAALLASLAVGAVRGEVLRRRSDPRETLTALNGQLHDLALEHRFVALTMGVYDPGSRCLELSNAGMPAALRIGPDRATEVDLPGIPLGALRESKYMKAELDLVEGEVIVLFSDGIEEAAPAGGEPFGVEGITEVVRRHPEATAQFLAEALVRASEVHAGEDGVADDRTALVFRVG